MNHPKIKRPCPFCGAAGTDLYLDERHAGAAHFAVECRPCGAMGPVESLDYDSEAFKDDAIKEINRASEAAVWKWNNPAVESVGHVLGGDEE